MPLELQEVDECVECGGCGSQASGDICDVCGGTGTVAVSLAGPSECDCGAQDQESHVCPVCSSGRTAALEGYEFDKFMDNIILKEGRAGNPNRLNGVDSPQRERARRHQEKPINRIKWGK